MCICVLLFSKVTQFISQPLGFLSHNQHFALSGVQRNDPLSENCLHVYINLAGLVYWKVGLRVARHSIGGEDLLLPGPPPATDQLVGRGTDQEKGGGLGLITGISHRK